MGEKKKEEEDGDVEIVLKVDMHCEACARKVARALKGFQGVEEVRTDSRGSKVVVKGKGADPVKVCERLQRKSGRKVELISPLPKPFPPPPHPHQDRNDAGSTLIQPPKEEEQKKEEPPATVTVVLNIRMHCEACAQVLRRRIRKIKGVESVETELAKEQVVVKGVVDPSTLVKDLYKKTGKQATIVKEEREKNEDKKDEKEGQKKQDAEEEGSGSTDQKKDDQGNGDEIVKHLPGYDVDFAQTPQIFSDENPNACSLM